MDSQPSASRVSVPLATAQTLVGTERFELRRELGAGGFGVVYEAFDKQHRATVALKLLHQRDPKALYQFKQEFRLLPGVVHPNLVVLYELLSRESHWFFTMELVDGRSLVEYVRDTPILRASSLRSGLDADRIRTTFLALARGLRALHLRGVLHLDLKPSNVRVTPAGRVVLLDFGLAKPLAYAKGPSAASPDGIAGTPLYMAPEQWWHLPLAETTDWYALGVMLYEALVGPDKFLAAPWRLRMPSDVSDAGTDLVSLCSDLLRVEPEARPSGDEVIRRLAGNASQVVPQVSTSDSGYLVGRDRELDVLADAFRESRQGKAVLVRVHGAAGVGKSALLQTFVERLLETDDAMPLAARCCEREFVPYKALDGIVDGLCHQLLRLPPDEARALLPANLMILARLFPVVRLLEGLEPAGPPIVPTDDPRELRSRAAGILQALLGAVARRRPLALLIDDLQWGDADSARLLAELLTPHAPPMLVVLAYRVDEIDGSSCLPELERLLALLSWTAPRKEIALEGLSSEHVERLVWRQLGGSGADVHRQAERIARESSGNPLLVEEFVRYVRADARRSADVELSLDHVVGARVGQLPEEARRLLELVAVAGYPLEQAAALQAVGSANASLTSLALLRSAHLLRTRAASHGVEVEIVHDRIRQSLVAGIDTDKAREYHRGLVDVLEAAPEPSSERLAVHFYGAGDLVRAALHAYRAAELAREALAFTTAAELYGSTLSWSSAGDPQLPPRRDLILARAQALVLSGRSAEAAPLFLRLSESSDANQRLDLERLALESYLTAGKLDEGLALASPVLARVGLRYHHSTTNALLDLAWSLLKLKFRGIEFRDSDVPASAGQLARIDTAWAIGKALADVQPLQATSFQVRSLLMALKTGNATRVARALVAFGTMWLWQGTPAALKTGNRFLERGVAIIHRLQHTELDGMEATFCSARAVTLGDWDSALSLADTGLKQLRRQGRDALWEGNMARLMALLAVEATHRASDMLQRGAEWHRVSTERGDIFSQVTSTVGSTLGLVAAGKPAEARQRLAEAFDAWPIASTVQRLLAIPTEAYADLYEGNPSDAWQRITASWPRVRSSQALRALIARMKFHAVRAQAAVALAQAGSPMRAALLRRASDDAALLAREPRRDAVATAQLLLAGVANLRGQKDAAVELLGLAREGFKAAGMTVHAACAGRQLGEMIGGEEGSTLVLNAEKQISDHGIADPRRWASVVAPGIVP